ITLVSLRAFLKSSFLKKNTLQYRSGKAEKAC
ncbi:bacterial regulatory helix-turn-helix, lysR family protein, partial [Vibrio parahaemolyticus V-223/04]